ncbi:MAG: transposase [Candidatus Omnitrophica bacterium]|nr:transposase [Candidatus Omnitrophota bacterium]
MILKKRLYCVTKQKENKTSNKSLQLTKTCSFVQVIKENIFGEIKNNGISVGADGCRPSIDVKLNEFGLIVNDELKNSEIIRNEIKLNDHVIMPNHIHGIVIIQNNIIKGRQPSAPTDKINQKQSLSLFVAGFKSSVTKRINTLRNTPGNPVWQRSFYDHIIRNKTSLNKIREYITNNPINWQFDVENPDRIGKMKSDTITV